MSLSIAVHGLAGDLQAAIIAHLEAMAKNEDLGACTPHDEDEEEDNKGFLGLTRWLN